MSIYFDTKINFPVTVGTQKVYGDILWHPSTHLLAISHSDDHSTGGVSIYDSKVCIYFRILIFKIS